MRVPFTFLEFLLCNWKKRSARESKQRKAMEIFEREYVNWSDLEERRSVKRWTVVSPGGATLAYLICQCRQQTWVSSITVSFVCLCSGWDEGGEEFGEPERERERWAEGSWMRLPWSEGQELPFSFPQWTASQTKESGRWWNEENQEVNLLGANPVWHMAFG
jgi:hypothetical protein